MKLGRLIRDGDGIRALAYAHALASVKAFPWRVTKKTDLSKIPNLGGGSIQSRVRFSNSEACAKSGLWLMTRTRLAD